MQHTRRSLGKVSLKNNNGNVIATGTIIEDNNKVKIKSDTDGFVYSLCECNVQYASVRQQCACVRWVTVSKRKYDEVRSTIN